MNPLVQAYTNKRVDFTFDGAKFRFDMSHGLFSSFDIDAGTKLLLKTIAQRIDYSGSRSVADIGCGTGVIGICIKEKFDDCECVFQDRDALALSFAESNCGLNGSESASEFVGGLGFQELRGRKFDLIVSNIPAKAGGPVLERILHDTTTHLSPEGLAAIVVVMPIADAIGDMLAGLGVEILHTEETREHRVYHFSSSGLESALADGPDEVAPYIRHRGGFQHRGTDYELETVYNLPDFDTLGRIPALAMDLINKRLSSDFSSGGSGDVVVWNPGQGHVPVYLTAWDGGLSPERVTVASRDALQLEITARNMPKGIRTHHIPSIELLVELISPASVSLMVLLPSPVPGVEWQRAAADIVQKLIEPDGMLLVSASSTKIHRLLDALGGMVLHGNRKMHGNRAVLLEKSN